MESLLKAIATRWTSSAGTAIRALATGGLWAMEAKEGVTSPYVVYYPLPGSVVDTTTSKIEEAMIQFSIYVASENAASTAAQIYDLLIALFDDVDLTMTGSYNMIRMIRRSTGHFVKDPDEGYALHVDYEVMYGK